MGSRLLLLLGAMAVLAAVALLLVVVGKPPREILPSSLSADPGGALGLYRLLEAEGIPVKRWFDEPIRDDPDVGAVIVFANDEEFSFFGGPFEPVEVKGLRIVLRTPPELPLEQEMETVSVTAHVKALEGVTKVYKRSTALGRFRSGLLREGNYAVVDAEMGTGPEAEIVIADGTMFLNQNLDQADNARLAVALVRSVLPPGKAVAFPEYAYGITGSKTIFQEIGPAYSSFVVQFLLLFFLLVWTLHRRFGYPVAEPVRQPGMADHTRALGYALRRAKAYDILLRTAVERTVRRESRRLGLPPDVSPEELAERLDEPLASLLRRASHLLEGKPDANEAVALAALLREAGARKTHRRMG
jgi:hypothetical protein